MKKAIVILIVLIGFFSCKNSKENTQIDVNKEEWISLFNGKNLNDWDIKIAGHKVGDNYKNTFRADDNMIRVVYEEYDTFNNQFGHIYYKKPFSYYKVKLDYRITGNQVPGGATWAERNSGIMLHSQSAASNSLGQFFPVSIEMQFLNGINENELRPTGNLCTPGTAVKMNDSITYTHCIDSSSKTYYGEEWIHVEAIVLGSEKVIHIIENDTVIEYYKPMIGGGFIDGNEEEWANNGIENAEEWKAKDGQFLSEGYIALQAESHAVDFKNIELLDLCGCMDKTAKNYKSYYVKADNTKCIYN